MLGVIIHWDHKSNLDEVGKRNVFQHFDYACRAYGVDKLVIVDVNGTMSLSPPHPVVRSLSAALTHFSGAEICFVHPNGEKAIGSWHVRPEHIVYVVGADYEHLEMPDGCLSLRIPVADPAIELWADQALAIVLLDKFLSEHPTGV